MPADEKEAWENKARKDKARYEVEKSMYKGPWKVPANKRTPKDPSAPKRPMSAFLAFSNKRRAGLKREHPDATNADLSKMLSKTWKEAPEELRKKYMEEEAELRAHYKVEMSKWRKKVAEERKQERTEREDLAMQTAEARANEPPESKNMGANGMSNQYGGPMPPGGGPNQGLGGMRGGQPMPPNDMNPNGLSGPGGGPNMYGNPYGGPGGQMGGMNSFGMQGSGGGGGPSDAAQYANMMSFGGQPFMGASNAQQQLIINQLLGMSRWIASLSL
jgi:HMG (high mobility group) box